jgi:hypothetical protein
LTVARRRPAGAIAFGSEPAGWPPDPDQACAAGRLRGAISNLRAQRHEHDDPRNADDEPFFDQSLIATIGEQAWEQEQTAAADMSLDETIQLARSLARPASEPDSSDT